MRYLFIVCVLLLSGCVSAGPKVIYQPGNTKTPVTEVKESKKQRLNRLEKNQKVTHEEQ